MNLYIIPKKPITMSMFVWICWFWETNNGSGNNYSTSSLQSASKVKHI